MNRAQAGAVFAQADVVEGLAHGLGGLSLRKRKGAELGWAGDENDEGREPEWERCGGLGVVV
jgi:hypothetical protein